MSRRPLLALLVPLVLIFACGGQPDEEAPAADPDDARYDNAGVFISILDDDAACKVGAADLDRETFARCAHIDASSLPDPLVLYDDPAAFDPLRVDESFLVGETDDGWIAMTGLGRLPAPETNGPLLETGSLSPRFIPILIGAGEVLVELGAGALLRQAAVAGVRFLTGRALVSQGGRLVGKEAAKALIASSNAQKLLAKQQAKLLNSECAKQQLADHCDVKQCLLLESTKKLLCRVPGECTDSMTTANIKDCQMAVQLLSGVSNCVQKRREVQLCFKNPDTYHENDAGGPAGHQMEIDNQCKRFVKCEALGALCAKEGVTNPPRTRPSQCASM